MEKARPPKSGRVRSVPMVDDVADALMRLRGRERFTTDDDFVFAGPLGNPFEDSAPPAVLWDARASAVEAGAFPRRAPELRHPRCAGVPALRCQGVHRSSENEPGQGRPSELAGTATSLAVVTRARLGATPPARTAWPARRFHRARAAAPSRDDVRRRVATRGGRRSSSSRCRDVAMS